MRTIFFIFFVWCCAVFPSLAQERYEVDVDSYLNIRSAPDTSAPVVGTISRGGTLEVYEIKDGWAKVKLDDSVAYVSADYLRKAEQEAAEAEDASGFSWDLSFLKGGGDAKWMIFPILGLSIWLFVLRWMRGDSSLTDGMHLQHGWVFLGVCALELVYVGMMGSDTIWFCQPDTVGWLWTIVDFVLFGIVVYNQILNFFYLLGDVQYNTGGYFDFRWGLYSWAGAVILGIALGIFFPVALPAVPIALLVCQVVQLVLIYRAVAPSAGAGNALFAMGIYLLGSLATILILMHFVALLIIVLIGYFVLSLFANSSSSRSCASCYHLSGGYCNYRCKTIYNPHRHICNHYR